MIPEVNPYNNYRGDGVATLFDYDFFIQNGSQLIVEHIDENDVVTRLEENIDYEIVVIEEEFAGYIKFPIEDSKFGILQENETLSLQLTLPFEQISEYGQSSLLDLNSIEFSYDYLTRLCQILKRQMERSVKVNEGSEATPEQLLETINNNAIVSTNAAALASKKADEAMESANVASGKVEEINNIYAEAVEKIETDKSNALEEIEQSSSDGVEELNKIKEETKAFKDELVESGMFKFNLFDTKISDHVLDEKEAKGWALQGTYVTKKSYPDFYNKCLEEKNNATATEVTLADSALTMFVNENGHQFYNIVDKNIVDIFYDTYGIADFYGIDEENERIFLPRFNPIERILIEKKEATEEDSTWYNLYSDGWLEQGGNAKTSAGTATVTLLKPYTRMDYTMSTAPIGSVSNQAFVFSGSYVSTSQFKTQWHGATSSAGTISWRTAGYSNFKTDLPSKYTYYCVGNTEVTQAITNVTEITTSENDTIPLFTGMYFDFKPNNVSWLKAGEQQNSGGIYKTCYETLVEIANGINHYDLKVINQVDMVSGIVYDEYWVLDQDNLTFRTPLTIATKSLSGAVVGNEMTLGLTNGTQNVGLYGSASGNGYCFAGRDTEYGQAYGSGTGQSSFYLGEKSYGITTDPTKSGIIAQQSTAQLYFKVANAVQNLEILDAERVMEEAVLRSTLVEAVVIIESYQNGTSWYNLYSNGWCEQGGIFAYVANGTVSLLKDYGHTDYSVMLTDYDSVDTGGVAASTALASKLTDSFALSTTSEATYIIWEAKGKIK